MKSSSFERHLIALGITVAFYFIPTSAIASDMLYFPVHAMWSIAYSILIYNFAKTRSTHLLLMIELISVIYTTFAYVQWYLALKSQWFYDNFEIIMLVCFLAELMVIMIGATDGAIHRLVSALSQRRFHDGNSG